MRKQFYVLKEPFDIPRTSYPDAETQSTVFSNPPTRKHERWSRTNLVGTVNPYFKDIIMEGLIRKSSTLGDKSEVR